MPLKSLKAKFLIMKKKKKTLYNRKILDNQLNWLNGCAKMSLMVEFSKHAASKNLSQT